jgi:hypothetical protein
MPGSRIESYTFGFQFLTSLAPVPLNHALLKDVYEQIRAKEAVTFYLSVPLMNALIIDRETPSKNVIGDSRFMVGSCDSPAVLNIENSVS